MTPKLPVTLRDNGDVQLNLEAVFEDPKATAMRWLTEYKERRERMGQPDRNCRDCHYFHQCHPDLPEDKRNGLYGLCESPWQPHHVQHQESIGCMYWTEREEERLQRQCLGCGTIVWKWLENCPDCEHDLRPKRRKVKMERPPGRREPGWLRFRRARWGY